MITINMNNFKTITSNIYNNLMDKLQLWSIPCPCCHHKGCLIRHGHYERMVKAISGTVKLSVLRVKCNSCGHTHAILPESLIPYSQLPFDVQQTVLCFPFNSKQVQDILNSNYDITESDISYVKTVFRRSWKERLRSMGIDCSLDPFTLFSKCYSSFLMQFMQNRRGVYFFLPAPT